MKVLDNIKRIRKSKGLSQEYVAGMIHIHTINYGKIENGITALTIERLYKIADILNVSASELLGEDSEIINENNELKAEIESLKIAHTLVEHDRNKVEMAVENWEELKNLRSLTSAFEYLDYTNHIAFIKNNPKYFPKSLEAGHIQVKEFERFFFSVGKNLAFTIIKRYIDIDKFEQSDLIIEESKVSGLSVEKIISNIKELQKS